MDRRTESRPNRDRVIYPVQVVGLLVLLGIFGMAQRAPAPLVFTPGEGWRYEVAGSTKDWERGRAVDQLEVARKAFEEKDYGTALRAAKRVVNQWPFSDYTPEAQYIMARCYEEKGQDERAFKAYQRLIERYPKIENYNEIIQRQFEICNRYLAGKWFKLWNFIPAFASMDRTIEMYESVIKNGPYSSVAPYAQMNIGEANEKKIFRSYDKAALAYERAADRYFDTEIGDDALYKEALAYNKQAKTAEYDQSVAAQAIATFTDFMTLYPNDARVTEAQSYISTLTTEQARGSYEIARFYERKHRWKAAQIYYNEVLIKDPKSTYADQARARIAAIQKKILGE